MGSGVENFGKFSDFFFKPTLGRGYNLSKIVSLGEQCMKQLLNICVYLYLFIYLS